MALSYHEAPARNGEPAPRLSAPALGERIAALLARFDTTTGPRQARDDADELARTIVQFYGDGLERVLEVVYDAAGDRGDAVIEALCGDKFVEALLVLHGLHPLTSAERAERALERARPYLREHDSDVHLIGVEGDVVRVSLQSDGGGCNSTAATVKAAVEKAILESMPDIREVQSEKAPVAKNGVISLIDLRL